MNVTVAKLPKSAVKLTIELTTEDMRPYLERVAEVLSLEHKVEGFRPGKASLGMVLQKLGAQAVWEVAGELAVRKSYPAAVREHQLQTVGAPNISVHKLAPDNPFIYHAEVAVLPDMTLGEYRKLKAKARPAGVAPEKVETTLNDLRQMFATESAVDRAAQAGDKIEIDFDLSVDGRPVEGGSSKQHPIVIGSKNFIPGFEDQLVGLKRDDRKEFDLVFPKDYQNKTVAGKTGHFVVTAKAVLQINQPALDDAFAKQASKFQSLAELRKQIEQNLQTEAEHDADAAWERALLDELISRTKFSELPEVLVEHELTKMLSEIQSELERRGGLKFNDYLTSLNKTEDGLKQEFRPQAERRVKSALLLRAIATAEKIEATKSEIDQEVAQALTTYAQQPELKAQIENDDYRDFARVMLTNRQVVAKLKAWASGAAP